MKVKWELGLSLQVAQKYREEELILFNLSHQVAFIP